MFAALCAALVAALLSLGGAALVIADQPQGKGGNDHAASDNGNGNGNAYGVKDDSEDQPAPAAAPAPQSGGNESAPEPAGNGGGSNSTATSGPGNSSQGCDGSHNSDTGHGANHSGPYDNTCDGSPSGNGNGGGNATGKPCAGCVGNADDKNPQGQYPGGSDHNAGYECDRNHGIGRTNPAHTGCAPTETTTTGIETPAPPSDDKPAGDKGCPGAAPLATALEHSAAVALKAVALMHPELSKLAAVAAENDSANCGNNANENGNGHTPITICHATGSATNPYVEITIDENGLNGHGDHQDDRDIIPAPAEGCPQGTTTQAETATPPKQVVTPLTQPETVTPPALTAPAPGEQVVLGVRQGGSSTPAQTTAPATTPSGSNEVLGQRAAGASAPAAAKAPAAANRAVAAEGAGGTLPFTGTDALLVLFLGCLLVLGGVALQRVLAQD